MTAIRILLYAAIAAIAACKIDVGASAGGSVTTNSGSLSCKAPYKSELEELVQLISQRVGRCLER